jgi:acyl-CoA synthetase (AMP-forming)/AMP-acid ligase II
MNLSLVLDMVADGLGDRVVLGRRRDGLTAQQARRWSTGGARIVTASGADCIVYLGTYGPAFLVAMFAAARAGVPLVPVNYRLSGDQIETVLARYGGGLGVASPAEADRLRQHTSNTLVMSDWLDRCAELASDDTFGADDSARPAAIIYTSGSTAAPKGVIVGHQNLLSYVLGTVDFASAGPEEASLVSVPPYHIAAVANTITNLYAGRRIVVLEQFEAREWVRTVRDEEITQALVVPTMLARIMELDDTELAVPSLRSLAYGGARMPAPVIERALRRWPEVAFVNAYGLTETSSTVAILGPDDHRSALASSDPHVRARLSSVGRPVPGVDLEVRDNNGNPVLPGATGRIYVRGDQVTGGYAGRGPAVDDGGFLDTRDEGRFDAEGYLFIDGRADDTIIRGAENIAPAEIEDVLLELDEVMDAVVVGIEDEVWGQHIEAAVVLRPGAALRSADLQEHVRARLRGSKTPDRVEIWDRLPRTETGKLIRREAVTRLTSFSARADSGADPGPAGHR